MFGRNHQGKLSKKNLKEKLVQLFHKDPENLAELIHIITISEQKGLIDPETRHMLEGVLDIANERVRDAMIPRSHMITLNKNLKLEECLDIIQKYGHSRYPIISEDKDHIEGILLAKDLLNFMRHNSGKFSVDKILRRPVVVPESKRIDQMLKEFRSNRNHMAIVVDEFGGVSGLITIEDILEVIVGDIEDEYDEVSDIDIRRLNTRIYSIRALTPLEDFNTFFSTSFHDNGIDTIGGFVMKNLGRLPTKGDSIVIEKYQFKVTVADERRIIQLLVTIPKDARVAQLETDLT